MPRITALLVLASVAGVLACADGSPTESSAYAGSAPALARGATPTRPAGGECRSQFAIQSQSQNQTVILIQLDCNLRHLGRTSGTSTETITFTGQTSNTLAATSVYTAANGDLLYASFTGTGILDPATLTVSFTGTETFTGGTGRFSGASGSVAVSGTASLTTSSGSYNTTGTLTY